MRVVHSRKKVWSKDYAFEDNFTLLTWILSIIKWKEYGFETVLYTDNETLSKIKQVGFDFLYDEINTEYLEDENNIKGIDFWCFWAMPKILSYKAEIERGYIDSIIVDTDIVPTTDLTKFFTAPYDIVVWSNKEYVELKSIYPELSSLSLPEGYKLPYWFSGKAKPLNTGILYFTDMVLAKQYLNEVCKIATNNHNHKNNTRSQTMCNAEQRLLGEFVKQYRLTYNYIQPKNEGTFNKYAFHTHGYKNKLTDDRRTAFNVSMLNIINKHNTYLYKTLIDSNKFDYELQAMLNPIMEVEEFKQYKKL